MKTLIAGLLALTTLGGAAAGFAPAALSALGAADPTCNDLAGQATVCQEVVADPASGVSVDADVDVHPTPPASAAAADPTCQDLAGHGSACVEADPSSGVFVDVVVNV